MSGEKQYHIDLKKGDISEYVLLPGDPKRVEVVASFWDEAEKIADNREYVTFTGYYKGTRISCTSTGIGCPSTAIALEELARVGATTFIRIGTCGTFLDHVNNGDLAIFDSALRFEGTTLGYAPPEYPAVASYEITLALIEACENLGFTYHVGTTRSSDTFYARHKRPGSSFGDFWQSDWEHHFEDLARLKVLAAEMEASTIMVLSKVWDLRGGGISVVLDNVLKVTGESGKFDPETGFDHSADHIETLSKAGSEAAHTLSQWDQKKKELNKKYITPELLRLF